MLPERFQESNNLSYSKKKKIPDGIALLWTSNRSKHEHLKTIKMVGMTAAPRTKGSMVWDKIRKWKSVQSIQNPGRDFGLYPITIDKFFKFFKVDPLKLCFIFWRES